jgi:hypothetical protein
MACFGQIKDFKGLHDFPPKKKGLHDITLLKKETNA